MILNKVMDVDKEHCPPTCRSWYAFGQINKVAKYPMVASHPHSSPLWSEDRLSYRAVEGSEALQCVLHPSAAA